MTTYLVLGGIRIHRRCGPWTAVAAAPFTDPKQKKNENQSALGTWKTQTLMDAIEFHDIMDCSGHVQLRHPMRPHHFYVMEERVHHDKADGGDPEYIFFYVSPFAAEAVELQRSHDVPQCLQFLSELQGQGWRMTDEEIPKYNPCRKWQFCRRTRNVVPQ